MEKEPITITYVSDKDFGYWEVRQGDKVAEYLGYDEVLGLISALIMPEKRPCLQWMRKKEN